MKWFSNNIHCLFSQGMHHQGQASGPTPYRPVLTQQHGAPVGFMPGAHVGADARGTMVKKKKLLKSERYCFDCWYIWCNFFIMQVKLSSYIGQYLLWFTWTTFQGPMNSAQGGVSYGGQQPGIRADRGEGRIPSGGRPSRRSRSSEGRLTQGARHSGRGWYSSLNWNFFFKD